MEKCKHNPVRWFGLLSVAILFFVYSIPKSGLFTIDLNSCADQPGIGNLSKFCFADKPGPGEEYILESDKLPLRRGTFLYLINGESKPSPFWKEVSEREDSSLLWQSWKVEVPSNQQPSSFSGTFFFPKSSYNTGRNRLLHRGQELEIKQGWQFEYFVFTDEDQEHLMVAGNTESTDMLRDAHNSLRRESLKNPKKLRLNSTPSVITLLHFLLLTYRPARGGIHQVYPYSSRWSPVCVTTPNIDPALDAYHRTAMSAMLPYSMKYNDVNLLFATGVANLKANVLLGPFAVLFPAVITHPQDVRHGQKHTPYAKITGLSYVKNLLCYVRRCLPPGSARAREFYTKESSSGHYLKRIKMGIDVTKKGLKHHDGGYFEPCLRLPGHVNYSSLFNTDSMRKNWF